MMSSSMAMRGFLVSSLWSSGRMSSSVHPVRPAAAPEAVALFYRGLYKDLGDEMRREIHAKPPPPMDGFKVHHILGSDYVCFTREGRTEGDHELGKVFAYGKTKLGDPSRMNELVTFLNWYPIEILIVRDGMVLQASVGEVESQFHIRNTKAFAEPEKGPHSTLAAYNNDVNYIRELMTYNGPYWGHLEPDVQSELHDTIFDHGVNPNTLQWFSEWIYYFEHVEYSRWNTKMLNIVLPEGVEKEEDLLTREERQELDIAAEEWLPSRDM